MSPKRLALGMFGIGLIVLLSSGLISLAHASMVRNLYPQHEHYWTGRVMNAENGYKKLQPEVMFGKSSDPKDPAESKWQGYFKFDLSPLPDNAVVTQASLFYYVISPGNEPVPWTYVTVIANDPVVAEPEQVWTDIVQGTVAAPALQSGRGWVERQLNAAGVAAIAAGLYQDWVAFGLYKYDEDDITGKGHVKGYEAEKFRPYLRVTYAAANMAIEAILAPAGDVQSGADVTPLVQVANRGEVEVPFELVLTIGDGQWVMYDQTVSVEPVPVGQSALVSLPDWTADPLGGERVVSATLMLTNDDDISDNHLVSWFKVVIAPTEPNDPIRWGWQEVKPLPSGPGNKPVRSGAWLAVDKATGLVYAARGNRTGDFYAYRPTNGLWQALAALPGRFGRGARGIADGKGSVYAIRGAGSQEFWRYSISENRWERLADVPLGPSEKKLGNGTDMVHVEQYGLDFIYLLKGPKQDFLRYNVQAGTWTVLDPAPAGASPKWKKGSFLVYDNDSRLYAHKAPEHELWMYDLGVDAWVSQAPGMPYATRSTGYRPKRIRDGGSATWREDAIYALKAGTPQFWRMDPRTQVWAEREPMPELGTTLKNVKVGQGADIVSYPFGRVLYALKGNKTFEFWRYTMPPREILNDSRQEPPQYVGVAGPAQGSNASFLSVRPNPVSGKMLNLGYAVPAGGQAWLVVYDATGRIVISRKVALDRAGRLALSLAELSPGTYVFRVAGRGFDLQTRVVVAD